MTESSLVKRKLLRYKELLANFTRRNKELYYRESKGSSINLSKPYFAANMFLKEPGQDLRAFTSTSDSFDRILKGSDLDLQDHFFIDFLKDSKHAQTLLKKLDKIRLADDKHQREFGISGAWVLGPFLCWKSSPDTPREDLLISPIFKVPVDLGRNKKKRLTLKTEKSELSINTSLSLYLKNCFGLTIPDDKNFDSVIEGIKYLGEELQKHQKSLSTASKDLNFVPKIPSKYKIEKDENGEILGKNPIRIEDVLTGEELDVYNRVTFKDFLLIDVLYLDQLNANRAVLINDYESIIEGGFDHPILNELFNGTPFAQNESVDRSKLRELDRYKERDNHFVVDIDSTQHRAIEKATNSKAIVIQGPPGTGKSQTIVNLIADYLARGKKVLFVSEKRPALDVVFNRLKSANIESQSVLIHSSTLNKSDLYKSFLELANSQPNAVDEREWQNTANNLDYVKSTLNTYADALQEHHPESLLPHAELIRLSSRMDTSCYRHDIYKKFRRMEYEKLQSLSQDLRELQLMMRLIPDLKTCPWTYRQATTLKTTALESNLKKLLEQMNAIRDHHNSIEGEMHEILGEAPNQSLVNLFNKLPAQSVLEATWDGLWSSESRDLKESIHSMMTKCAQVTPILKINYIYYESFEPSASPAVIKELEQYYSTTKGPLHWLSKTYWQQRKLAKSICSHWDGTHRQFLGHRLYSEAFENLHETMKPLRQVFIPTVTDNIRNLQMTELVCTKLSSILNYVQAAEASLPSRLVKNLCTDLNNFNNFIKDSQRVTELWHELLAIIQQAAQTWSRVSEFVSKFPPMQTLDSAVEFLGILISRLNDLETLERMDATLERISKRYELNDLKSIVESHFFNEVHEWTDILTASVLKGWADEVRSKCSSIRFFDSEELTKARSIFKDTVENHKIYSRQAVHQAFAKRWTESSDKSGLPLLSKESTKQKKVLSPREIMEKGALTTMMQLKPCWLMSPLSISQILPLKSGLFDVIIFDEASQVRVEDAIPSIFRAVSMIVVGDDKQMPPTNFFSGNALDDDDDEEEEISESVLDLALQVFPSVLLEWHYRSRAESLIAFSNRAYYGGRLIAAPNPAVLTAGNALTFHEVPAAYFIGKSANAVEAEAIVNCLLDLIRENDQRSYGVIAMGQPQTVALEDALDRRCQADSQARQLIDRARSYKDGDSDAGLFIKNLENVQGDERDIIIISVGYGPPSEGKKLRLNFGPLSSKGGGRRLNVAITRARLKMHVFCSFSPNQVPTDEETFARNPDLCTFGRFLKYTEAVSKGNTDLALNILNSFGMGGTITSRKSSGFALDVKRRLEDLGYLVSAEIGSSGFYIDLAIHHPVIHSNFVLGIECDGAIFHSTPYARDRDKIREDLLKSRGWKIERVWSQDWSKDWEKEIYRLDTKIKELLKAG